MTEKRDERYEIILEVQMGGFFEAEYAEDALGELMDYLIDVKGLPCSVTSRKVYDIETGEDVRRF